MTDPFARPSSPKVILQKRNATDPDDYVSRCNATYADDPRGFRFSVASIDGRTASGRIRYTIAISIDDPHHFDRIRRSST